jgi:sulfide:quinone oxidoreductase
VAQRLGSAVDPEPFRPVLRGLLLTGLAAAFLRADEGGSTAAFEALWSPPAKVAARYLGPYLEDLPTVGPAPQLADRASSSGAVVAF